MARCTKVEAKEGGEICSPLAVRNGSRISDLTVRSRVKTCCENVAVVDMCTRFCACVRSGRTALWGASFVVGGELSTRGFPSGAPANRYAAGFSRCVAGGDKTNVTKLERPLVVFLTKIHERDATLNIMLSG
jgi:hypothetical protein